jgi:hypothetical protein
MLRQGTKRGLITLFMLFHMIAFALWSAPLDFFPINSVRQFIGPYMRWSGLFQAWDMFAPDPSRLNGYLYATITFKNGQQRRWVQPRLYQMGYLERYQKERYRKFMEEHLWLDAQSELWPDAARHLARMFDSDPSNPPAVVRLTRHWSFISVPGPNGEYRSTPELEYTYFSYDVMPEDLE